jgi:hypothetical protein
MMNDDIYKAVYERPHDIETKLWVSVQHGIHYIPYRQVLTNIKYKVWDKTFLNLNQFKDLKNLL